MAQGFDQKRRVRISADTLAAVAPFICREEVRYYLNGVYVEPHRDGGVIVTATDGHTLATCRDENGSADRDWICSVPPVIRSAALRGGKGKSAPKTVHFIGSAAHVLSEVDDSYDASTPGPMHLATAYAPAIDGTFPDWRRAAPGVVTHLDGAGFSLNPHYFTRFAEAGKALGAHGVTLLLGKTPNDPIGVRVGNCQRFFGLVMPMRFVSDEQPVGMPLLPEWCRPLQQAAAE
ncbi:MAG TPA: hypothetical protein VF226_01690 [Hyphomicrobiaceae bacterium]